MGKSDDKLERLFDENEAEVSVSNRDLRWMLLMVKQDFRQGLDGLQASVAALDATNKALESQIRSNAAAITAAQKAHDDCPLSTEKGRDGFVEGPVKDAVRDAVREANGTKPMVGPLNRGELFQVMGWVIMALVVALVFVASKGEVRLPLP